MQVIDPLSGLTIYPNRMIDYYVTATVTVSCEMNFEMFPMDKQTCYLYVQSSNYDIDKMKFSSSFTYDRTSNRLQNFDISIRDIPEVSQAIHLLATTVDFLTKRAFLLQADHLYTEDQNVTYCQVGIEIHMKRFATPYILSFYAPLCAMVFVSWISFIVPPDAIPGRVGILVTVFLVLSTFFGNIQVTSSGKITCP